MSKALSPRFERLLLLLAAFGSLTFTQCQSSGEIHRGPSGSSNAQVISCAEILSGDSTSDLFESDSTRTNPLDQAQRAFNAAMTRKYPELGFITKDPGEFYATIRARFDAQKSITPEDPYQFDFSELGLPLLTHMRAKLAEKAEQLSKLKESLYGRNLSEVETALRYGSDLEKELTALISKSKISYRRMIEVGFFYSRLMGHFDSRTQGPINRFNLWTDRILNGYNQYPIGKEYRMYQKNEFTVFSGSTPVRSYRRAEPIIKDLFFNKNELQAIFFPTDAALGYDIFFQLMPFKIYPIGVTDIPLLADGILRPGGDFWNHDIRHASDMFLRMTEYIEHYHLNPSQFAKLRDQMAAWYLDLTRQIEKIQDKTMRDAIQLVAFNLHHERGYLLAPSSYLKPKIGFVPYALYSQMKISEQIKKGVHYDLDAAYEWLRRYWLPKLPQEAALLNQPISALR